jgi:hypothetical protein
MTWSEQRTLRVLPGLRIFCEDSWTNRGPRSWVHAIPPQLLSPPVLLLSRHILLDRFSPAHPDFHFDARPERVAQSPWGWDSAAFFVCRVHARALTMMRLINLKSRRV